MPAQALYRKWRPQLWDEVVGQEPVVQTLRHALGSDHIAHAYLFSGPRGCGKTTTARLVAKALNCLAADATQRPDNTCAHCLAVNEGRFLDLIEIDGASNNGVDNIRELREKINFAPGQGRYKIYIIDEVHMLSAGAFNALLKTLEEPPPHAVFILATTESYKIPATVSSRCQRFEFRRIPVVEIVARLQRLCVQEQLEVEKAALEVVARQATGSLRDAISLLDQLVGASPRVTLAQAQELLGTSASQAVAGLVETIAAGDLTGGLQVINAAIDGGADPRQLARQVVDYLRNMMLVRLGNAALVEVSAEARAVMARQAERLDMPALLRAIRAFNLAANDARGGWQPQLPLELAMVECVTAPVLAPAPQELAAPAGRASSRAPTPASPSAAAEPAPPRLLRPVRSEPASLPERPDVPGRASAPPREAKAASPAATLGETTAGTATRSAAELKGEWGRVVRLMRERGDKVTEALLNSCTVVGLEGQVLRLSTNEFVVTKISSSSETRTVLDGLVSEVLGLACTVKFEVSGRASRSARADDIPEDGLVATALDLGGEIVDE
jgi:DNA polymerase-3 subunit gamma/tau